MTESPKSRKRSARQPDRPARCRFAGRDRKGFSLIELLVVMSVAVILTGLLMPALSQLREAAHRVVSASNMRQLDMAVLMYANDCHDKLPYSYYLDEDALAIDGIEMQQPQELMIAHLGTKNEGWDGLGLLFRWGYAAVADVYYCPSHRGEHLLERYQQHWHRNYSGPEPIYTNYHYCGHVDWETLAPRTLEEGEQLVVLTDGLRSKQDFNHVTGMNVARGDGSVRWIDNAQGVYRALPNDPADLQDPGQSRDYKHLWRDIEDRF